MGWRLKVKNNVTSSLQRMKILSTTSSYQSKKIWLGNRSDWWATVLANFLFGCVFFLASLACSSTLGFPDFFVVLLRIRGFQRFEFVNSFQQQPVCRYLFFRVHLMIWCTAHCPWQWISAHLANRASLISATDSFFSRCPDPYTHACEARPLLTDVGLLWVSLSLSSIEVWQEALCPNRFLTPRWCRCSWYIMPGIMRLPRNWRIAKKLLRRNKQGQTLKNWRNVCATRELEELILTLVWWITQDFRSRKCISEHSLTQWSLQAGKSTSRLKYRSKSAFPHTTMHWIKEVEIAKSIDDLMTSQSIRGRTDFPSYNMVDAMIASALKKLLNNCVHFRKRVSVEEQRAQKYDRFLRGRQIACMIYEQFRATGACEAVQGLSDLFNIRLHNDDVQDFGTRWIRLYDPQVKFSTESVLEGLHKSKLQDSVQLQTAKAM